MSAISPPGRQQHLPVETGGTHDPAYLARNDPDDPGPDTHIPYWAYVARSERRETGVKAIGDSNPLRDDRVVGEALTCACGRPAGADGLCYACRADHDGEVAGNGRRL